MTIMQNAAKVIYIKFLAGKFVWCFYILIVTIVKNNFLSNNYIWIWQYSFALHLCYKTQNFVTVQETW